MAILGAKIFILSPIDFLFDSPVNLNVNDGLSYANKEVACKSRSWPILGLKLAI